jgi:hypothetical protein
MNQITLKLYTLLCFVLLHLQMWAQDDDYMASRGRMSPEELSEGMEGMMEYSPVHIRFSDIIMVVFILVCCYVFGKIWKGCT